MARALNDILTELNSVYQPQKDLYNTQINQLDPAMQAEDKGLEAQKQDSFQQITNGANRRGLLFSGIPLQEQAQYVGASYLPAVANLKAKYAQQRFNLQDALAKIGQQQYGQAYDMYNTEIQRDEAARAARAASAGSGVPSFGGGGAGVTIRTGNQGAAPQGSLRDRWQQEAQGGDWNAQVALNYAGNDGRYDGHVNSQAEYDILKGMGIQGNYYVPQQTQGQQNAQQLNPENWDRDYFQYYR